MRSSFQFIISTRIVNELIDSKKAELINWGIEFFDYSNKFSKFSERECKLQPNLTYLTKKDRYLMIDAWNMGCDVFLTMDYRMIWNKKNYIKFIKVMRPIELLTEIKPYFPLFY